MTENEFQVGKHTYRAKRLSAKDQFHVARKMSYTLFQLGGDKTEKFVPSPKNFARVICVTTGGLAQSDLDSVLDVCLGVVSRQVSGDRGWAPIQTKGVMMFEDISMPEMLELVWHVIDAHRLVDFLAADPSDSKEHKKPD